MIHIGYVKVTGKSERGDFEGQLSFAPGLQVITARNSFGKSLAAESIAWCLGLEVMLGRKESDPSFFPEAVLEELDLPEVQNVKVISSQAEIGLIRQDGEELRITRAITHDRNKIHIERRVGEQSSRLTLLTGYGTMVDETTGFQRFLFEWIGWPIKKTTTFEGGDAYVYLENLAPLFYIEQEEGWTELQARQIGRYGQQQIREIAVEYLLGATTAVDQRVSRQRTATRESSLRASARVLAERANQIFHRQGWAVEWSGNGSVKEILARWSSQTIQDTLQQGADVNTAKALTAARERLVVLREKLTKQPIDASNVTAAPSASQSVIDLKQRRHRMNSELRTSRGQYSDTKHTIESLDHRIRSATDVHRLKTTGVGRLTHLECPTCHRDLDLEQFQLTEQTGPEVEAHIEALKRDRALTKQTLESLAVTLRAIESEITRTDGELRNAQRALEDVEASVGPVREQIVKAAADLAAQERLIDRLLSTQADLKELQDAVDNWIAEAKSTQIDVESATDIERRTSTFRNALGQYLVALGHSAAVNRGVESLRFDFGQYEPFLDLRRLRALGSGSDPARLIGAYSLALAAASADLPGLHPGFVILDEPLQQNPDTHHIDLFLNFLSGKIAKEAKFQTLVFTFLTDAQRAALRLHGVNVIALEGHFLAPIRAVDEEKIEPSEDTLDGNADTGGHGRS